MHTPPTTTETEDALIKAMNDLGVFSYVASVGRDKPPAVLNYPACMVFFTGDSDTGNTPRPVRRLNFTTAILAKNLTGEKAAADAGYALIDSVRDAVHGKYLGLVNTSKWACSSRRFMDFTAGVVTYIVEFNVDVYLTV
jgi:hypothetical protein